MITERKREWYGLNITVKNEYRVEAEISADEMEQLGINYGELDYSSVETRRFLWSVIEEIRGDGIDVDMSGRVLIEAFDGGTGGCTIAFTVLPRTSSGGGCVKQLVKNTGDSALITSARVSELIGFSKSAGKMRSELYFYEGAYRLFLFPENNEREKLSKLLPEFYGVCSGSVAVKLAQCREKGELLRKGDAVHMLSLLAP